VNLKDYRVCVVRVTFADITLQSSILANDQLGAPQIRWKDILRFEHVKVRCGRVLSEVFSLSVVFKNVLFVFLVQMLWFVCSLQF
jgi:hypothetical protein